MEQKIYTITKKIAKQGNRRVILLPKILEDELKPSSLVKLTIEVLREAENE